MSPSSSSLGLIGLGTMGSNLARNLAQHGITTVVTNRTTEAVDELLEMYPNPSLHGAYSLEELVEALPTPRIIGIIVTAGAATDAVLQQLLPLLARGDIIIDFGNAYYQDTARRVQEAKAHDISFIGCGLSGGEEGALRGPSLMAGGDPTVWDRIAPILETIAAKDFAGNSCAALVGEGPSGHYVKMIHNGIEYGIMGVLGELYALLRYGDHQSLEELAPIFRSWNTGLTNSFLLDAAIAVLEKKDQEGYVIDRILDYADQKGTGTWTAQEGLLRTTAIPSIVASVFQRIASQYTEERQALHKLFETTKPVETHTSLAEDTARDTLEAAMILLFVQGLEHIRVVSDQEEWNIALQEVCRIWQGGCIIRTELLRTLEHLYASPLPEGGLLAHPFIYAQLVRTLPALRRTVTHGVATHTALPVLSSILAYIDGMTHTHGAASMIQGLRDYFGAHTYRRVDQPGYFHTLWHG